MKYQVLKIKKISDNYYDVDMREMRWFRQSKDLIGVRVEYSAILGVVVSTGKFLHNFRQILNAYDCTDINFTEREEALPMIHN